MPYYNSYLENRLYILHKISVANFIIPLEIVYDEERNVIGYTKKYIKAKDGDAILKISSKFLIEELEKVYNEVSILSQNNIVLYDLASCNVIVNESGIFFIDTDDYIIRNELNYNKNMRYSNFYINIFLKEIFARSFSYKKMNV